MKKLLTILSLILMIPLLLANTLAMNSNFQFENEAESWNKIGNYYYFTGDIFHSNGNADGFYILDIHLPDNAVIEYKNNISTSAHGTGGEWKRVDKYDPEQSLFNRFRIAVSYFAEWGGYYTITETNINSINDDGTFIGTYIVGENLDLEIRYYEAVIENPSEFNTLADLPNTADNILGNVYFTVLGNQVILTIWYSNTPYTLKYNFSPQTDMTLFNTEEAYFIKRDGKPQIFINKSDRLYLRDILSANSNETPAFVPHVIWDLNTNTLSKVEKYNAYAYVKQNPQGVLVAYYYVDEFIMDNILSTTLTYTSRKVMQRWGGLITEKTEWQTYVWSHTSDSEIEYRDLTASWQLLIPVYNLIFANIKTNTYYRMPAIQALNFNNLPAQYNVTKSEIETKYAEVNSSFNQLKNNPRYKVWAFALQEGANADVGIIGNVQTEFYHNPDNENDPKNLKIIEIVYMTDEKIYTTVGQDMNLHIIVEPDIDGIANEKETIFSPLFWSLAVLAAALVMGFFNGNLLTKKGLNMKYVVGSGILSLAVYLVITNWDTISNLMVLLPWLK